MHETNKNLYINLKKKYIESTNKSTDLNKNIDYFDNTLLKNELNYIKSVKENTIKELNKINLKRNNSKLNKCFKSYCYLKNINSENFDTEYFKIIKENNKNICCNHKSVSIKHNNICNNINKFNNNIIYFIDENNIINNLSINSLNNDNILLNNRIFNKIDNKNFDNKDILNYNNSIFINTNLRKTNSIDYSISTGNFNLNSSSFKKDNKSTIEVYNKTNRSNSDYKAASTFKLALNDNHYSFEKNKNEKIVKGFNYLNKTIDNNISRSIKHLNNINNNKNEFNYKHSISSTKFYTQTAEINLENNLIKQCDNNSYNTILNNNNKCNKLLDSLELVNIKN